MSTLYVQYPAKGVPIYPSVGQFPPGAQTGQLAVAADTQDLYVWNGTMWVIEATPGGPGSGTVTSVGLSLPGSVFTVSGSPVTTAGTLTGSFNTQAANTFLGGPVTGAAAAPTFRVLALADLPISVITPGSSTYSMTATDTVILADTTSTPPTINLVDATLYRAGQMLVIKDNVGNALTNSITITAVGGQNIDGASSLTITQSWGCMRLISNGSNWRTI